MGFSTSGEEEEEEDEGKGRYVCAMQSYVAQTACPWALGRLS
jgi:hypothetical protein